MRPEFQDALTLGNPSLHNAWGHLRTITHHKACVMDLCFKLGLYRQGLAHDLSKYSPTEFLQGACFYQGNHSPNDEERRTTGLSTSWLHHKGRNRHHFEYWIDYTGKHDGSLEGKPMPTRYVVEMFCDRVAACKVYQGEAYSCQSPLAYYERNRDTLPVHPDSKALLEGMLTYLAEHGEEKALQAIRNEIIVPRYTIGEHGRF